MAGTAAVEMGRPCLTPLSRQAGVRNRIVSMYQSCSLCKSQAHLDGCDQLQRSVPHAHAAVCRCSIQETCAPTSIAFRWHQRQAYNCAVIETAGTEQAQCPTQQQRNGVAPACQAAAVMRSPWALLLECASRNCPDFPSIDQDLTLEPTCMV